MTYVCVTRSRSLLSYAYPYMYVCVITVKQAKTRAPLCFIAYYNFTTEIYRSIYAYIDVFSLPRLDQPELIHSISKSFRFYLTLIYYRKM